MNEVLSAKTGGIQRKATQHCMILLVFSIIFIEMKFEVSRFSFERVQYSSD